MQCPASVSMHAFNQEAWMAREKGWDSCEAVRLKLCIHVSKIGSQYLPPGRGLWAWLTLRESTCTALRMLGSVAF